MSKKSKTIKASDVFKQWHKDPAYLKEVQSLEDEFALAQLFISARGAAGLTQSELAEKMKTSQAYVARLESGKEKPSTRTLNRIAQATGHKVIIQFQPLDA
jgi:ribosome-binding protein aMBF1 (putative translation factor)